MSETEPEEFTGTTHAIKADPKGKRINIPHAVKPLAEELATPAQPITKPGTHPKHAIARPRREHEAAQQETQAAQAELVAASRALVDAEAEENKALLHWLSLQPKPDTNALLHAYADQQAALRAENVKAGLPPEGVRTVSHGNSETDRAAATLSTKLALFELRGMLLQESIFGYDEIQTKDGQVVWAIDATAAAMDPDEREALGFRRDALLEIDGKLQPVVLKKKAPFAQQLRLLEAAFPDLRPSQTINQNINGALQVGVGLAAKPDYTRGPPAIPPAPKRPELPAPVDAEFSEVTAEDDLFDILGPEPPPEIPAVNIDINVTVQEAPQEEYVQPSAPSRPADGERVIRDTPSPRETQPRQEGILAPPPAYDEPPRRAPRNALEKSLFDELDKARARKAQL